ncbi:hypothetical protein CVT26_000269 [Gymnopilus dilepis]|uniref:Uncharacterized protein n=1 Tax=Gymnopilus dilepis TaxID=231916 RepID=A0A409WE45_9AGAR|nr:hypothetical protein CVT26_000269 [Gymnopilus dilepis]
MELQDPGRSWSSHTYRLAPSKEMTTGENVNAISQAAARDGSLLSGDESTVASPADGVDISTMQTEPLHSFVPLFTSHPSIHNHRSGNVTSSTVANCHNNNSTNNSGRKSDPPGHRCTDSV